MDYLRSYKGRRDSFCKWILRNRAMVKLENLPGNNTSISSELYRDRHVCRGTEQIGLELDQGHLPFTC